MTYTFKCFVLMTVLTGSLTGCATMQSTNGSSQYNPGQECFWCVTLNDLTIHEKILR